MKLILAAVLLVGFQAQATQFQVDKAHSGVEFKVRHLLGKTSGKFKDFEGDFTFDEKKPDLSNGNMKIKVASIDTNDEKRDGHLKSPDFFDAEKYDSISYVGKTFKKVGNGKYKLIGEMTMRGVTKPVTFDVEYLGTIEKDPMGKTRASFVAKTVINRKDFGIVYNKTMDESLMDKAKKTVSKNMIGDDVEVELNIEAVAKK